MRIFPKNTLEFVCDENLQRYFTPQEANRSLVLVRRIVGDIVRNYQSLLELQESIEIANDINDAARAGRIRRDVERRVEQIRVYLEELDLVGANLRDWAQGIVDFPCLVGEHEVALCWRFGEDRVRYWHEVASGCESRHDIETLNIPTPLIA